MQTVKLTKEMMADLAAMGYEFPPKKKRPVVHRVTLDSRFTDGELCTLYNTINRLKGDPKWRLRCFLVRFALGTGMRESEITRVRFSVFPDQDQYAEAHWNGVITVRNGKGGKSRDACCIPELLPHYQEFLSEQRVWAKRDGYPEDGFAPLFGKVYDRTTLWRWWKKVLDQCPKGKVRPLDFHAARRTYGTWEYFRFKEATTVKALMGHSQSSDTFEKHYNGTIAELAYGGEIHWYKAALGRFGK